MNSKKYHISKDGVSRKCVAIDCKLTLITSAEHATLRQMGIVDLHDAEKKLIMVRDAVLAKAEATAKVKTAYRETSALFGIKGTPGINVLKFMSSEEYLATVKLNQPDLRSGELRALEDLQWERGLMPGELVKSLENNFKLGARIRGHYYNDLNHEGSLDDIRWVGDDTSLAPADITVNGDLWSLKEDSEIIKNGGGSTLLNTLTGTEEYGRGFHALDHFAEQENLTALHYAITEYNTTLPKESQIPYPDSYTHWNKTFDRNQRKELARWITSKQAQEPLGHFSKTLNAYKDAVNDKAGSMIVKLVGENPSAGKMLAIDKGYYYGKISGEKIHVGYIPSDKDLDERVTITDVSYKSGRQLDIIITYKNQRGEELQTVNEIRYSHGQFFGIPEAKMKILKGDFTEFVAE